MEFNYLKQAQLASKNNQIAQTTQGTLLSKKQTQHGFHHMPNSVQIVDNYTDIEMDSSMLYLQITQINGTNSSSNNLQKQPSVFQQKLNSNFTPKGSRQKVLNHNINEERTQLKNRNSNLNQGGSPNPKNSLPQNRSPNNDLVFSVQKNYNHQVDNNFNEIQSLLKKKNLKLRSKTTKLTRQENQNNEPNFDSKQQRLQLQMKHCEANQNSHNDQDQLKKVSMQRRSQKFQHIMEYKQEQQVHQLYYTGEFNHNQQKKSGSFYNTQYGNFQQQQSNVKATSMRGSEIINQEVIGGIFEGGFQLPNLNLRNQQIPSNLNESPPKPNRSVLQSQESGSSPSKLLKRSINGLLKHPQVQRRKISQFNQDVHLTDGNITSQESNLFKSDLQRENNLTQMVQSLIQMQNKDFMERRQSQQVSSRQDHYADSGLSTNNKLLHKDMQNWLQNDIIVSRDQKFGRDLIYNDTNKSAHLFSQGQLSQQSQYSQVFQQSQKCLEQLISEQRQSLASLPLAEIQQQTCDQDPIYTQKSNQENKLEEAIEIFPQYFEIQQLRTSQNQRINIESDYRELKRKEIKVDMLSSVVNTGSPIKQNRMSSRRGSNDPNQENDSNNSHEQVISDYTQQLSGKLSLPSKGDKRKSAALAIAQLHDSMSITKQTPQKHILKQKMLQIKPLTKNQNSLEEKICQTPGFRQVQIEKNQHLKKLSGTDTKCELSEDSKIKFGLGHNTGSFVNQRNDVLINMNMTANDDVKNMALSSFKQNVLNIQRINIPQAQHINNAVSLSPSKMVQNKNINSPVLNRKSLLSRRQPTNEKMMQPNTGDKSGITKRLLFRRRERMKEKNLIIIYYDGIIGDTNQYSSYNNFRLRYGSIIALRKLYSWAQVVVVMPYATKRAKVIVTYLEKHQGCPIDAIYTLRQKQLGKTQERWYRYQQIFEDFDVDDEEKIISNVMVSILQNQYYNQIIGSYNKEVYDKQEFYKDFKNDQNYSFGQEPSSKSSNFSNILLQNTYANLLREGCSGLSSKSEVTGRSNKVNPVTLIVPHLKLETNNCNFIHIVKCIENMKYYQIDCNKLNDNQNVEIQNDTSAINNRSMQSTSIENSDFYHGRRKKS
ncbi:UNKNOWN [Stylonychia lemnae]|uniref:Uncharacterized protein n=1 Tax=Stylonychia lemnae TaxID=5949 RepID=A0A078A3W4_STYLE|nr:UNKNOWN [Stylonychia lemnae]|eukprot:CDW76948.1 UNKNOWN [Stylonychia lemnae]